MTFMIPGLLSKISLSKYFTEISRTPFPGAVSNQLQWKLSTYQSLEDKLLPTCESLRYRLFVFLPPKEKGFPHFGEHIHVYYEFSKVQTKSCIFYFPCATLPRLSGLQEENEFHSLKVKYTLPEKDVLGLLVIIKCKRRGRQIAGFPPPLSLGIQEILFFCSLRSEETRHLSHLAPTSLVLLFIYSDAQSNHLALLH